MAAEIISHASSLTTDERDGKDSTISFIRGFICGSKRFIFEPIPNATHGDDQIFASEFLADMAQMHIHDALFPKILTAPDFLEQLLAGEHASAIFDQCLKQVELDGGQLDQLLVHADGARAGI